MPDLPNRDALEAELARKLARLFSAFVGHVLELVGSGTITANNIPTDVMDQLTASEKAVLLPFLERVAMEAAERLQDEIPVGVDWALVNERAASWAREYAGELVRKIDDNHRKIIRRAISDYFELGQTLGELRKNLMMSGKFGPARAEAIAVTEVTRAAAEGEIRLGEEIAQGGVLMIATWNTNRDELVCPICTPLNGRQATGYTGTRRPYWDHPQNGNRYGPPPSAHPRDRCWINWELPKV